MKLTLDKGSQHVGVLRENYTPMCKITPLVLSSGPEPGDTAVNVLLPEIILKAELKSCAEMLTGKARNSKS